VFALGVDEIPNHPNLRSHHGPREHARRRPSVTKAGCAASRGRSHQVRTGRGDEWLDFVVSAIGVLAAGSLSFGQRKLLELAYVLVADPTSSVGRTRRGVNLTDK